MVYIRGLEDDLGGKGVLINAHYDNASTGFGATDDRIGVVTVLQLIKYFTTPGNRPKVESSLCSITAKRLSQWCQSFRATSNL